MRGRWDLTQEERDRYIPYIVECIKKLDTEDDIDNIDLTDTPLNPENMRDIMKELGYTEAYFDCNGWEFDFWIKFTKEEAKDIVVSGCGMTFGLYLERADD